MRSYHYTDAFLARDRIRVDVLHPLSSPLRHPSLLWQLTVRAVVGRYRGASLGLLWSVATPFLMLIVYAIAFGSVLRGRWQQPGGGDADFTLVLFVGLIVHGFFAECLVQAPNLVVGNPNLVKRVVFPLEILPWPMLMSALFNVFMNVLVLLVLYVFRYGMPPWTVVLFPVVMMPLAILTLGVGWFLASLGVYFRDVNQVTGVIATAMLFLSTAIVPVDSVPKMYQPLFYLNPLSYIIDQARVVALWGGLPDWQGLGLYAVVSLGLAWLALAWFQMTRKGFADVL